MKKYLSYGFVLGILVVSGITPVIISSNNIENTVQNSSSDLKEDNGSKAPEISSFDWTTNDDNTKEDFAIGITSLGTYDDGTKADTSFTKDNFSKENSKITYGENNDPFKISDLKYDDNSTSNKVDDDIVTGTVSELKEKESYTDINFIVGAEIGTGPTAQIYQFSTNGDLNGDGTKPDIDITNTNGQAFTVGTDYNNSIAPQIDSFDWKKGETNTEEAFEITLSNPGSYQESEDATKAFSSATFDDENSSMTYGRRGESLASSDNIEWTYNDGGQLGKDTITGTVSGLTEDESYININLTLAYKVGTGPTAQTYQFSTNEDLNGNGYDDLDITDTYGNGFTVGKEYDGTKAPVISDFKWNQTRNNTSEKFEITLSDPGYYNAGIPFTEDNFNEEGFYITYGSEYTPFELKDVKYSDNNGGTATITGKTINLDPDTHYSNINIQIGFIIPNENRIGNDQYNFSSYEDLNGDGKDDLRVPLMGGKRFTTPDNVTLPSFTLADDATWDIVSDDSAEITLSEVDWGTDADGNAYTEKDLNSDLSYVAYDDSAKEEMPYEDVNLALKDSDDEKNTVVLELSNLDSETKYNISSIHLVFGEDASTDDSMVTLGDDGVPVLTTEVEDDSLGGGAIFGIVLGSLIIVGLIAYLIYYFIAKNKKDNDLTKEETQV